MRLPSDIAHTYRNVVLSALSRLKKGDTRPKTLHRLRTHLRRLQAYAELVGESANAKTMGECVSYFSPLRTLDVLESYLVKRHAPKDELRLVRKRISAKRQKLRRKKTYEVVERLVRLHAVPPVPGLDDWLPVRMRRLRELNCQALRDLALKGAQHPRRKILHALRLKIKAVRYQEEWVVQHRQGRPQLVAWLKHAQKVLGEYEEYGQFRKLARKWRFEFREPIEKDWKRARKEAHAIPARLLDQFPDEGKGRLRLVPGDARPQASSRVS
jgi:CHAD domain-containing protein